MYKFIAAILLAVAAVATPVAPTCKSQTQPNPIADKYNTATGVINGSLIILPIPYSQARSLVPAQYPILTKAYQSFLKGTSFPTGMYPAFLQAQFIHDLRYPGGSVPDFFRASIGFPFVDRLNDGYTSMMFGSSVLLSADATMPLQEFQNYNYTTAGGSFQPQCDAYAAGGYGNSLTTYTGTANTSKTPSISVVMNRQQQGSPTPYSLDFFKNVTNQPQFSYNTSYCQNFIRLFNTSVTESPYTITPVKGSVAVQAPVFPQTTVFPNVDGIQLANAWLINNYLPCQSLQGYHGTGSGD